MGLTLGEALAYLEAERAHGSDHDWPQLAAAENGYLRALRQKLQALTEPSRVRDVFMALPEGCCQMETSHAAQNEDLFLISFLATPSLQAEGADCLRLSKHLNDCYRCFDESCEVVRDYHRQSQQLSRTA